jgi:hypothetical protein
MSSKFNTVKAGLSNGSVSYSTITPKYVAWPIRGPMMLKQSDTACCPPKPAIRQRPLLTPEQAADLMDIFKVLASDTRLRLLEPALGRWGQQRLTDDDLTLGAVIGVASLVRAIIGARQAHRLSTPLLRGMVCLFLLAVGVWMIAEGLAKERAGNKLPACFWYIMRPD